jgi:hypothetical protein
VSSGQAGWLQGRAARGGEQVLDPDPFVAEELSSAANVHMVHEGHDRHRYAHVVQGGR